MRLRGGSLSVNPSDCVSDADAAKSGLKHLAKRRWVNCCGQQPERSECEQEAEANREQSF